MCKKVLSKIMSFFKVKKVSEKTLINMNKELLKRMIKNEF